MFLQTPLLPLPPLHPFNSIREATLVFGITWAAKLLVLPPLPVEADTVLAALPLCLFFIQTTSSLNRRTWDFSVSTLFVVILSSFSMRSFYIFSISFCTLVRMRYSAVVIVPSLESGSTIFSSHFFSNAVHRVSIFASESVIFPSRKSEIPFTTTPKCFHHTPISFNKTWLPFFCVLHHQGHHFLGRSARGILCTREKHILRDIISFPPLPVTVGHLHVVEVVAVHFHLHRFPRGFISCQRAHR